MVKFLSKYSKQAYFNLLFPCLVFLTMQVLLQTTQLHSLLNLESMLLSCVLLFGGLVSGVLLNRQNRLISSIVLGCLVVLFLNHVLDWEVIGMRMRISVPVLFLAGFIAFWYMQDNIITILLAGIGVIFLSTILLPSETTWNEVVKSRSSDSVSVPKASIIHIILDGHLGIEAFPKEIPGSSQLKSKIIDAYLADQFRLFGRAFSRHNNTFNAVPELLNLRKPEKDRELINSDPQKGFVLKESSVFKSYQKHGYAIKVYQTDAMDFCGLDTVNYCLTAPYKRLDWLSNSSLSLSQKLHVLASTFMNRSTLWRWVDERLTRFIDSPFLLKSFPPINMVEMAKKISTDLDTLERGTVLFAHILLPHEPSALNTSCDLRPPKDWSSNDQIDDYKSYFAQMECTYKLMENILTSVKNNPNLDDATIVINGDHGSRLGLGEIDYRLLSYPTLMAIRTPGLAPGYVLDKESVPTLFSKYVTEKLELLEGTVFRDNTIDRKIKNGGGFITEEMPDF